MSNLVRPTDKQKAWLWEDLETYFDRRVDRTNETRDIGQSYSDIGRVIYAMNQLRLSSFRGRSYRELKQLHDYIGRIFFHRRLNVTLQDFQHSAGVGINGTGGAMDRLPTTPHGLDFKLQLEGLDDRKVLICTMHTWTDWSRPNYLSRNELVVSLGQVGDSFLSLGTMHVSMHYRTRKDNPTGRRCWQCSSLDCRYSRRIAVNSAVLDAYERFGIAGVWKVLDKAWVDLAASRPMTMPLSQESLHIRCEVHKGKAVKVITPEGPLIGILDNVIRNEREEIISVRVAARLEDFFDPDVPSTKILDILPCRPEYEPPYSLLAS